MRASSKSLSPSFQPIEDSSSVSEILFDDAEFRIEANFRNMPLPDFIQEALGVQLGLDYMLDPRLGESDDLVTLTLAEELTPRAFYETVKSVLREYGVGLKKDSEILKVVLDKNAAANERPLVITGSALPNIPVTHRPVFASYPLRVLRPPQIKTTLQQIYKTEDITISSLPDMNSIIYRGKSSAVREAIEATRALDQPLMLGKNSLAFKPTFIEAEPLAQALVRILTTEGYAATSAPPFGSIIILPFSDQQRILIFANDRKVLNHVIEWAEEIDDDKQRAIRDGFFSYEAKNITAEHIAKIISALEGEKIDQSQALTEVSNSSSSSGDRQKRASSKVAQFLGGKLVIDGNRNVLFFNGSGKEWARIRGLIEKVDQPVPMVLSMCCWLR